MLLVNSTSESVNYTVLVISASESIQRGLWCLWWLHMNSKNLPSLWTTHLNISMYGAYELCACIHKIYALLNSASESIKYTARTTSACESLKYTMLMNSCVWIIICAFFLKATSESIKAQIHTYINWHFLLVSLYRLKCLKDIWRRFTKYVLFPNKKGTEIFW